MKMMDIRVEKSLDISLDLIPLRLIIRAIIRGKLNVSAIWVTLSSSTDLNFHSGSIIKYMRLDHKPNSVFLLKGG